METETTVGKLAWHVHHETLYELLYEPIEVRRAYILRYKPQAEIDTRLRLLKLVGNPPDDLVKAYSEWNKAYSEWNKALEALHASELDNALEALHAVECPDCPWNGRTIFPEIARTGL